MSKENQLVPELRFPEFVNEGEWEEKKLDEVCERITQGGTPDTTNSDYWNGSIEWITPAEMGKIENKYISSTGRKITEAGLKNCSSDLLPINSVILSTRAPIGHLVINKSKMAMNQGCKALIPNNHTSFEYIYYCLLFYKNSLSDLGAGNTFKELSASSLKNFEIFIPKKSEQQKIASCLSSLDELINAHIQKLDALKDHKKGLMQQLFPAEGETVPKLRFKEFEKDGEWLEKCLGDEDVSFFVNEKVSVNKLNVESYISTENMLPDFSGVSNASKLPSAGNFTQYKSGDILISNIRPYLKKVWKSDRTGGASNDVNVFRSGSEVLCDFLEFILKNEAFINYIMESAKGVKMPRGDKDSMKKYIVFIPSKAEQQKIANFLSSIDHEIAAQTQKIEALKEHKKGLMQGLFPTIRVDFVRQT
jgi:type I restriction enzyme S subunit